MTPITLSAQVVTGHQVQLAGHVDGALAPGASVAFSGAAAGSCLIDSSGDFSFTTAAASLGTVFAVGMLDQSEFTAPASADIVVAPASLAFSIAATTNDSITFSGTLSGLDVAGQTIQVSGATVDSIYTDSQGNFSFTVSRTGLSTVEVSETDLWGQESNVAQIDAPPFIDAFSVTTLEGQNTLVLQGHVNAVNVNGLIVTFSGIPQLENLTASVNADGSFSLAIDLSVPVQGNITAVISQDGITSNIASSIV